MSEVIAVLVFAFAFTLFALLGPAERSRPCGGRGAGEQRCGKCPGGPPEGEFGVACPGIKALEDHAQKRGHKDRRIRFR